MSDVYNPDTMFSVKLSAISGSLVLALLCCLPARGQETAAATLVEAREFEPCGSDCAFDNHHSTHYCFHVGTESLIAESKGALWMNEDWAKSKWVQDHVGKQVAVRYDQTSIWLLDGHRTLRKLIRGTNFEFFSDPGCLVEVHKPKLALAASSPRPATVPADAFPLAADRPTDEDFQRSFLWFSCLTSSDESEIECRKWNSKGETFGTDRYCAKTVAGNPISPTYQIDRLISRERRIVLSSGEALMPDGRGRKNDRLDDPEQPCKGRYTDYRR